MLDDQILQPPATYSVGWTLLGAMLLVLVVAVPIAVTLATRPVPVRWPGPVRRSVRARRACLRRIDEVEGAHRRGELDGPAAASELSQALRRFAADWSGTLYPAMTLTQIEASDAQGSLRRSVADLYHGAFDPSGAQDDVTLAAARAREVVERWSRG